MGRHRHRLRHWWSFRRGDVGEARQQAGPRSGAALHRRWLYAYVPKARVRMGRRRTLHRRRVPPSWQRPEDLRFPHGWRARLGGHGGRLRPHHPRGELLRLREGSREPSLAAARVLPERKGRNQPVPREGPQHREEGPVVLCRKGRAAVRLEGLRRDDASRAAQGSGADDPGGPRGDHPKPRVDRSPHRAVR